MPNFYNESVAYLKSLGIISQNTKLFNSYQLQSISIRICKRYGVTFVAPPLIISFLLLVSVIVISAGSGHEDKDKGTTTVDHPRQQ